MQYFTGQLGLLSTQGNTVDIGVMLIYFYLKINTGLGNRHANKQSIFFRKTKQIEDSLPFLDFHELAITINLLHFAAMPRLLRQLS